MFSSSYKAHVSKQGLFDFKHKVQHCGTPRHTGEKHSKKIHCLPLLQSHDIFVEPSVGIDRNASVSSQGFSQQAPALEAMWADLSGGQSSEIWDCWRVA